MFTVIFEVEPGEGRKDAYLALAAEMKPVLESIDGFVDNERFASRGRAGRILSLSTWRDEKSVIRWRTEARHHLTQEKGRFGIFSDYHLRVGEVTADTRPPQGLSIREQRFDATETGRAKACTITELEPDDAAALPDGVGGVLHAVGLDPAAPGLVGHDVFASIYRPGKLLVLGSWAGPEAAGAFGPIPPAATGMRHRAVRVIRDYGMFDRRESPQYYPDVVR
ncbi:antibiotic biosynthesis monooxygenase family protein [Methylobacterium trifolii]|uniref:ABM domain-containing protein n=1 Tax=Methylobacterium trifolii TaxID=1003092 RepID=A0ABQ4U6Y0_9HYPH|nr:antibiotic biosynthesis monooxygenase [Methylobacterium trifolii]GJE61595.1 hypothetical protein MPOCJGCO_3717 [Methylobacterium trifolii]